MEHILPPVYTSVDEALTLGDSKTVSRANKAGERGKRPKFRTGKKQLISLSHQKVHNGWPQSGHSGGQHK